MRSKRFGLDILLIVVGDVPIVLLGQALVHSGAHEDEFCPAHEDWFRDTSWERLRLP